MTLLQSIWAGRNEFVHGTTTKEACQRERQWVIDQVITIYNGPPKLARRYRDIFEVPLESRIKKPTQILKIWITRINHQIKASFIMANTRPPGQLTIHEGFRTMHLAQTTLDTYPP